jgi:hypothetical protein
LNSWNRHHLEHVLTVYIDHYNTGHPHRGIDLDVPLPGPMATVTTLPAAARIERLDMLGGLIHEYRHAACARIVGTRHLGRLAVSLGPGYRLNPPFARRETAPASGRDVNQRGRDLGAARRAELHDVPRVLADQSLTKWAGRGDDVDARSSLLEEADEVALGLRLARETNDHPVPDLDSAVRGTLIALRCLQLQPQPNDAALQVAEADQRLDVVTAISGVARPCWRRTLGQCLAVLSE